MTALFTLLYLAVALGSALLVAAGIAESVRWLHHRISCAMCRRSRASRSRPRIIDFETRRGL